MSLRQPLPILILCLLLVSACKGGRQEITEDERSAFGPYVYQLDTAKLTSAMGGVLKGDTSRWAADKTVRKRYADISRFEETPLWFSRMGVSADADSLLAFLRREAPRNGLDTLAFFVPQIADDIAIVRELAFDSLGVDINDLLPRLDYCLSKAYVRYVTGQRFGFLRPDKLFNRLQMKPDSSGYAQLFDYEVKAPDYQTSLNQLSSGDRMQYLVESVPASSVYKSLQNRLLQSPGADERKKLALNMERSRWQVSQPASPERMVIVNIPALQLWVVGLDSVLNMRIVCGASKTKTPLLISAISHIQVNPEWVIPLNILKNEVAHHAGDSAYFARNHYSIIDRSSGDTLDSKHVSADLFRSGRVRVAQRGGSGNSLGRIVFRFQNNFAVYLHDTNNPDAFKRDRRTLSHGCVRVQDPFSLACFLLPDMDERMQDRLRLSMDLPPVTDEGREYLEAHAEDPRPFRLVTYREVSPHVPVYIVYYTAYPNPATGGVEQWPDLYGYDAAVSRAAGYFMIKQ
ncbi:MAG: L,D-transpeptidase family protein [Prevotella sp.]|nr:L,D-transpeptidase family protein [Prevotella sp.]